jgi:hypothetical protein
MCFLPNAARRGTPSPCLGSSTSTRSQKSSYQYAYLFLHGVKMVQQWPIPSQEYLEEGKPHQTISLLIKSVSN